MRRSDIALAFSLPVLWGVVYTLAKPALAHFPPIFMMALVYAITAASLLGFAGTFETPWWALALIAALGATAQSSLIFTGLAGLPASTAILVVQLQVPFAVLAAWAIGKERLDGRRALGVAFAFAGVALVAGFPQAPVAYTPFLLVVLGTLAWGVAQAVIRVLAKDEGSTLAAAIPLYAAPQLLAVSFLVERGQLAAVRTAGASDWAALLAVALGGFALAYSIWYRLLRRYRVDQVTPFVLLMPFVGVAASAMLLGERVSLGEAAGGGIIIIGLAVVIGMGAPRQARALRVNRSSCRVD